VPSRPTARPVGLEGTVDHRLGGAVAGIEEDRPQDRLADVGEDRGVRCRAPTRATCRAACRAWCGARAAPSSPMPGRSGSPPWRRRSRHRGRSPPGSPRRRRRGSRRCAGRRHGPGYGAAKAVIDRAFEADRQTEGTRSRDPKSALQERRRRRGSRRCAGRRHGPRRRRGSGAARPPRHWRRTRATCRAACRAWCGARAAPSSPMPGRSGRT
jgi:hypothetical protein